MNRVPTYGLSGELTGLWLVRAGQPWTTSWAELPVESSSSTCRMTFKRCAWGRARWIPHD
jgi:hypothetical protein